jgi:hypothetical protein
MPTTTEPMTAQELTQQQARRSSEDDAKVALHAESHPAGNSGLGHKKRHPRPLGSRQVVGIKKDAWGHTERGGSKTGD